MATNKTQPRGYDKLYFKKDEIPYLVVRDIRAEVLYLSKESWGQTPEEIADDRSLDFESVNQAIAWCKEHRDLVTLVLERERREADIVD